MSKKIYRVHTIESVFVGPQEPNSSFPPGETLNLPERLGEWSFQATDHGIVITQRNPRALSIDVPDGGRTKRIDTPQGQVWQTLVGWGNVRDVQYEPEPIAALAKTKGAA